MLEHPGQPGHHRVLRCLNNHIGKLELWTHDVRGEVGANEVIAIPLPLKV